MNLNENFTPYSIFNEWWVTGGLIVTAAAIIIFVTIWAVSTTNADKLTEEIDRFDEAEHDTASYKNVVEQRNKHLVRKDVAFFFAFGLTFFTCIVTSIVCSVVQSEGAENNTISVLQKEVKNTYGLTLSEKEAKDLIKNNENFNNLVHSLEGTPEGNYEKFGSVELLNNDEELLNLTLVRVDDIYKLVYAGGSSDTSKLVELNKQ